MPLVRASPPDSGWRCEPPRYPACSECAGPAARSHRQHAEHARPRAQREARAEGRPRRVLLRHRSRQRIADRSAPASGAACAARSKSRTNSSSGAAGSPTRRVPPHAAAAAAGDASATQRLAHLNYSHLSFESGYAPALEVPGRERFLDYAANRHCARVAAAPSRRAATVGRLRSRLSHGPSGGRLHRLPRAVAAQDAGAQRGDLRDAVPRPAHESVAAAATAISPATSSTPSTRRPRRSGTCGG